MGELLTSVAEALGEVLRVLHSLVEPVTGAAAWGWAIILLTLLVRVVMLPLAVKQINSMRAMQRLQPEIKKLQAKYKTDRSMMRTDPEKYRERRAKQQEEMMKLYKEHNVNPAAGCLPLLLQMPIFFALFRLLSSTEIVPQLNTAGFYFAQLAERPTQAGLGAWALIALMGYTTYFSQKQMMASNPGAAENPQQRMMLYLMPVVLTVFAVNLQTGVLLYWVTTNIWTMAQQWVMFRGLDHERAAKGDKA
ncbi:MAG TPA: YidC/Oxa1 family membrane protein insertase [Egibacteraceae bacterium]|nr:YidC/Oxa1 family membrane protein insertase [Egibacteraceae bacterium]